MIYKLSPLLIILFTGCSFKSQPISKSATIIFKTPTMKFYDKGFVNRYDNYTHLQVFNVGSVVLDLKIYKDEVCRGTFECMDSREFNSKYLNSSYSDDFLYNLFLQKKINYKDKKNKILIKIKKDRDE